MSNSNNTKDTQLFVGIDVGSTTTKIVAIDPEKHEILLSNYKRHNAAQAQSLQNALTFFESNFPNARIRLALTGSGAKHLAEALGCCYIQEVVANSIALQKEYADVGTAIELGGLLSGKTKIDIILTPLVSIGCGSAVGLILGPPISTFMAWLGSLINWGTEQQPFLMGIVVSVLMGMALTLPISSAALGIILNLSGIAAGAATIGCCAQMIGFATASLRENGIGGLLAQGIGTSMLQVPNIVRKPLIWLPPIITSAILGPISTVVLKMTNNAIGSGMGTAGFVGPMMTYKTMTTGGTSAVTVIVMILVMQIIAPAFLTYFISEAMRRAGLIKDGDMKLDI